jgi:hypothetical protein
MLQEIKSHTEIDNVHRVHSRDLSAKGPARSHRTGPAFSRSLFLSARRLTFRCGNRFLARHSALEERQRKDNRGTRHNGS